MKRLCTRRSAGASLTDLLVVVVLIPVVGILLIGCLRTRGEGSGRVKCAANLKSIGQALLLYANDNKGLYPRTRYKPGPTVIPTWGTGAKSTDPFGPNGPEANDVTAAMFLLMNATELTAETFVCPSSNADRWDFGGGVNTSHNWSNWEGAKGIKAYLSYSMQNPYPDDAAVKSGFTWGANNGADYAIMADINPGIFGKYQNVLAVKPASSSADMRKGNSPNHSQTGQNVLYGDGHVDWHADPFAGRGGDNIYARRAKADGFSSSEVRNSPRDADDNVLLPTSD